jgi:hypothetical protein
VARNGDVGAGRRIEREAVDELHAQGDRVSEGTARATLAEIALLEGDRAEAEREARLALELLVGKNARRARALAVLARALLHGEAPQAQREEALARATEALSLLESLGGIDAGGTLVALSYAEALSATGDRPRAEAVIADSCALIATRAAKISDPRRRADFLARNAEHALTFALARAWGVPHAS